jgi:hypothetical protein
MLITMSLVTLSDATADATAVAIDVAIDPTLSYEADNQSIDEVQLKYFATF